MRIRRFVATGLIVGVSALGLGGAASAQTQPSPNPATNKAARCERAKGRLPILDERKALVKARIERLNALITQAQAKNRDDLVAKLQARLARVQTAHDKVVGLIARIHERCDA